MGLADKLGNTSYVAREVAKFERIVDYTSYWPNGQKKGKYQKNFQTKDRFYTAHDADGRQVYPKAK